MTDALPTDPAVVTAGLRSEFITALTQALEIEQQRSAEIHARIIRSYEDAKAFSEMGLQTLDRIKQLKEDLQRLLEMTHVQ